MFLSQGDVDEVYLQVAPVDFRKGILGLAAMIEGSLRAKPGKKLLYAFTDRSKRKVKIVYWDATGYAMWSKILESEKFRWPKRTSSQCPVRSINLSKNRPQRPSVPRSHFPIWRVHFTSVY